MKVGAKRYVDSLSATKGGMAPLPPGSALGLQIICNAFAPLRQINDMQNDFKSSHELDQKSNLKAELFRSHYIGIYHSMWFTTEGRWCKNYSPDLLES